MRPFSELRPATTTSAPAMASASAHSKPIPPVAPVTIASLPFCGLMSAVVQFFIDVSSGGMDLRTLIPRTRLVLLVELDHVTVGVHHSHVPFSPGPHLRRPFWFESAFLQRFIHVVEIRGVNFKMELHLWHARKKSD